MINCTEIFISANLRLQWNTSNLLFSSHTSKALSSRLSCVSWAAHRPKDTSWPLTCSCCWFLAVCWATSLLSNCWIYGLQVSVDSLWNSNSWGHRDQCYLQERKKHSCATPVQGSPPHCQVCQKAGLNLHICCRWRANRCVMDARAGSNRAVVVSVAQFDPGVSLGDRAGAQKDAKRLHGTLSRRGFEVELHSDLSGDEIYELFVQGNISMEASCVVWRINHLQRAWAHVQVGVNMSSLTHLTGNQVLLISRWDRLCKCRALSRSAACTHTNFPAKSSQSDAYCPCMPSGQRLKFTAAAV